MKVLVTGGTGFTGSHLTRRLLQNGNEVVVIDNQPGMFHDELKHMGADVHIGSVTDRELVRKAVKGCEVVHHTAAMFRKVNLPKQVYWDVNVEGTRIMLEESLRTGVRCFVNCSTCGIHGDVKQPPAAEDSPIAPEDYYQYTKYEGEKIIPEFLGKGMHIVTLRPTAIYGPGDPERFVMLFRQVKKGRFLMFGSGKAHYHPVYIDNLVDGFELAAESENGDGEAYLIADESSCSIEDLVRSIGKSMDLEVNIQHLPFWPLWATALVCEGIFKPLPVDAPLFRRRVNWFRQNRSFSIEKARKDLGYSPKVGLAEGLTKTAEWYRQERYLT